MKVWVNAYFAPYNAKEIMFSKGHDTKGIAMQARKRGNTRYIGEPVEITIPTKDFLEKKEQVSHLYL